MVRGSYNLTRALLKNAADHGVEPGEVWEVISSERRLFVEVAEGRRLVVGQTLAGRWLGLLAEEVLDEGVGVWDITAARELREAEIESALKVLGGGGSDE
jgi:hypothetical protein